MLDREQSKSESRDSLIKHVYIHIGGIKQS
jgi:hypothetical protein